MQYLNQKNLKDLAGNTVEITKVYPAYRKGFNLTTNKPETFKVIDGKWQEEKWVDGQRTLEQKEPSFQVHKKVYDIIVKLPSAVSITVPQYNKDTKANEMVDLLDDEFTIKELGASKIRGIAEATVAFGKVPTKEDGTPAYDWEDSFIDKLSGVSVTFSTKNVKKKIGDKDVEFAEYMFREVRTSNHSEEDGLPF